MNTIKMESKTYQYRKVTKPLLERKRRARINKCLDNLKDLMIDNMRQQGDNISRLEKADILELTVEHLKKIKCTSTVDTTSTNNIDSFRSGYIHAANEVSRALATFSRVDINMGTKLMSHLGYRLNEIQQQQQQVNAFKEEIITSPPKRVSSPLRVYCGSDNYNQSTAMISPSPSSGYGSDSEFSSSPNNQHVENANVWRPW